MEGITHNEDQEIPSSNNLQFVFYLPNQPPVSRRSEIPIWEKLTHQVGSIVITRRFHLHDCLKLFSHSRADTALEAASNLGTSLSPDKGERAIQSFLLLSLCALLDVSGRAAPEEIDGIVKVVTKSTKLKYLDTIKRGARVANEIIAEWAGRQDSSGNLDHLQQLDKATQGILQGKSLLCSNSVTNLTLNFKPGSPLRNGQP